MEHKKMHPNSLANLKPPFQIGNAGGPGRMKKRPISEEYDELVREAMPPAVCRSLGVPPGTIWARGMAIARVREAMQPGGTPAAKEIREAIEGKAMQRIELSRTEGQAPEFIVLYENGIPGEHLETELMAKRAAEAKKIVQAETASEEIALALKTVLDDEDKDE